MKFKMLKAAFAGLVMGVSSFANSALITWDLLDPDSSVKAVFVYDDDTLNSVTDNSDLVSITGDFGDGIFTYLFDSSDNGNRVLYDTTDLSLIRFTNRSRINSINSSASGDLSYNHAFFDRSRFELGGSITIADWNGKSIEAKVNTDLNVPNSVPEPSTLAILALGMIGLGARRFKK